MKKLIIYTDGSSSGNPGPAGIGVVIFTEDREKLKEYSQPIGEATNNVAEYKAIIFALEKVKLLFGKKKTKKMEVEIRSDSELVVKQLNGEYKILEEDLQPLFIKVWNLKLDYKKVEFVLIPRESNKIADKLAKEAIEKNINSIQKKI